MKFDEVHNKVKDLPFISESNARQLYDFIIKNKPGKSLELGFAHGKATCYIAAALDEVGSGSLVAVDLQEAKHLQSPSIESLLSDLNLGSYVEIYREQTGYNWFLYRAIKNSTTNHFCHPSFDLCIIDGPKNWTIDSSAFFLVHKLLNENGWIIFDDYEWTYGRAELGREATDGITHRHLSEEEKSVPHIKEIFELLVMQHPDFGNFRIHMEGDWAWAQKIKTEQKTVTFVSHHNYKDLFSALYLKMKRKLKKN